jgi:hypothetical protein
MRNITNWHNRKLKQRTLRKEKVDSLIKPLEASAARAKARAAAKANFDDAIALEKAIGINPKYLSVAARDALSPNDEDDYLQKRKDWYKDRDRAILEARRKGAEKTEQTIISMRVPS